MIRMNYATLRSQGFCFFFVLCFDALHGVAASCHVIHGQEGGDGGGAAEPVAPLRAGAGSPQAAGVARCPPQRGRRVQLAPAARKGVWRESALRGCERLPARRHTHRLALCKKTVYLLLASKVSQDSSVPQHTPDRKQEGVTVCSTTRAKWRKTRLNLHVQWFLGLRRLLLWAVADESISMWQVQVECDEWAVLHAQSPQGGAINLRHGHMGQAHRTVPISVQHLQLWSATKHRARGENYLVTQKHHDVRRIQPLSPELVLLNARFVLVRRWWLTFSNSRPDYWCVGSKPLFLYQKK